MAQYLREPGINGVARTIDSEVALCGLSSSYPGLWEHLTETAWPSGKSRMTSTLLIFVEEGLVKLCLNDRSATRTAWVSGRTLTEALEHLNSGIEGDSLEWRRARYGKKS